MDIARVFHPAKSKYLVFTIDYLIPVLIIGMISFALYLALYSPLFKISYIECSLDFAPCNDQSILAELEKIRGKNIFTFKDNDLKSKFTSGDFTIRRVSTTRALPGNLKVELESVYPVVAIQVIGDANWAILDEKFRFIGTRTRDPNVPTVLVSTPLTLTLGKVPTDPLIIETLNISSKLNDELFKFKNLTVIDQDEIKLTLLDNKVAIFTPKKNLLEQLQLLQAVLSDDTISKGAHIIDVRFSQPVLR